MVIDELIWIGGYIHTHTQCIHSWVRTITEEGSYLALQAPPGSLNTLTLPYFKNIKYKYL